jgi:hypothetical protein
MTTEDLVDYVLNKSGIVFDRLKINKKKDKVYVTTYSRNIPNLKIFEATYAFEYNKGGDYFRFCILGIVIDKLPCVIEEIKERFPNLKHKNGSWFRVYFGDTYHKNYLNRSDADVKKDVDSAIAEMKSFMNNTEKEFFTFIENKR